MLEVVRPCMFSKGEDFILGPMLFNRLLQPNGDDSMQRLTLSDRVCYISFMQKFHAARRPIVFVFKEQ